MEMEITEKTGGATSQGFGGVLYSDVAQSIELV